MKKIRNLICLVICFVFVALLISCASSQKLFVPKKYTVNMPGIGPVQTQRMLVYVDNSGVKYRLNKIAIPGAEGLFGYSIGMESLGTNRFKGARRYLDRVRATPGARPIRTYAIPKGPFKFIIDGKTYILDDYSEITADEYIVYSKSASLGEARHAILHCSQLSIDGGEISPNGIVAIKSLLDLTPKEIILNALQTMD